MNEVKDFFNKILDVVFPSDIKCIFCGEEVNESELCICDDCDRNLERCEKVCEICGTPVKSEANVCLICLNNKREFCYARAPLIYKNKVISAVHNFKYNGGKYLAKHFAMFMLPAYFELEKLVGEFDFIIPVPLHKDKLKKRGYNQSELLADELAKLINIPVKNDIVEKLKNTGSQTNLSRKERIKNMKDVFSIKDKNEVKGKNILIVDDVLTTGATTESIAKLLKKSKAKNVAVLAFARTDIEEIVSKKDIKKIS